MRKTLLSLAVLGGVVALGGAAHATPAKTAPVVTGAHVQSVQYYDPDWREHEHWRRRREEEWRRREAWRDREEWRDRRFGGPPAVVVTPPPVVYGHPGW